MKDKNILKWARFLRESILPHDSKVDIRSEDIDDALIAQGYAEWDKNTKRGFFEILSDNEIILHDCDDQTANEIADYLEDYFGLDHNSVEVVEFHGNQHLTLPWKMN